MKQMTETYSYLDNKWITFIFYFLYITAELAEIFTEQVLFISKEIELTHLIKKHNTYKK